VTSLPCDDSWSCDEFTDSPLLAANPKVCERLAMFSRVIVVMKTFIRSTPLFRVTPASSFSHSELFFGERELLSPVRLSVVCRL